MMQQLPAIVLVMVLWVACWRAGAAEPVAHGTVIYVPSAAGPQVRLAAAEVRRYVYQRCGVILPVVSDPPRGEHILLARDANLAAEAYRMQTTVAADGSKVLMLAGGSDLAVLYAAYQFAEHLGVRFYLHGDVIPDRRIAWVLPDLDRCHAPLFATRGIVPFHDFTEGPDWWEADDYKAHFTQMVKMRMNWMGLHCYPEGPAGPEPLVWIGHPADLTDDGAVRFSPPSRWASTNSHAWGHAPVATSRFAAGAAWLFEEDDHGPSVTRGHRPQPATAEACNEVFERSAGLLGDAFGYGRRLGVKVCLGTETPLTIPRVVQERLRGMGLDPASPEVRQKIYEGMFARIAKRYPVDTYWLWTPEDWTWRGASQAEIDRTAADIKIAMAALKACGSPFQFGTCGWELGPKQDRSLFDELLPKDAVMSCINRNIGFNWVDREFLRIQGRPKWAVPWLEDDSVMVLPQLWAGRLRRDAADARAYGCSGLLGIHWRTKILAPNISALAQAAWSQPWNPEAGRNIELPAVRTTDIRLGGNVARSAAPVAGTDEDGIYQDCCYDLAGYKIAVPNGTYDVTLKFCEIAHRAAEQRVFDVLLEGRLRAARVDVFAAAGRDAAHDITTKDVRVADQELNIDFRRIKEHPFIAGIVIAGRTDDFNQFKSERYERRINCGGPSQGRYEADLAVSGELPPVPERPRDLPCVDHYMDFTRVWLGPEVADQVARIFIGCDGDGGAMGVVQGRASLPRPTAWLYGPGALVADRTPWSQRAASYAFVSELERLREQPSSAGDRERFNYWLHAFQHLRAVGQLACARGALDSAMEQAAAAKDASAKKQIATAIAVPARVELARAWERMMTHLLAATDTPGELGTIANLEQATRAKLKFIEAHDTALTDLTGLPLPVGAQVGTAYQGEPRIIVPTQRNVVVAGESLTLKVLVLDAAPAAEATMHWRELGTGRYQQVPLQHRARGVYQVALPAVPASGLEYHLKVKTSAGRELVWPATAPVLNFTVVSAP